MHSCNINCEMCDCCDCCGWSESGEKKASLSRERNRQSRGRLKYHKVDTEKIGGIDVVLPQYEKIPVDKIFELQQPRTPVYVHPQISNVDSQTEPVVTQQPAANLSPADPHEEPSAASTVFSLYYDIQRRVLTVYLKSAKLGLGNPEAKKQSLGTGRNVGRDSFVVMFLIPHKEQVFYSAIAKKTSNPLFDEKIEFTGLLPNEIRRQSLVLRLFEKVKSADVELGTAIIPLEDADLYGVSVKQVIKPIDEEKAELLKQFDSHGSVLISLMYDPSSSIISGVLLKAKNLQKMDISGLSDPYVKIYLVHKGDRVPYKWKSSVKKKTLAPIYNESFQFDITGLDTSYVQLHLKVLDHDILGSDDLMGIVEFGLKSGHPTGKMHWTEMTSSPNNQVCLWHSLEKPSSSLKRLSLM